MSWASFAAILGFMGVALGAFGAHALRSRLSAELAATYQTAVLYHLVHAVALFALGVFARATSTSPWPAAPLFTAGILIFSGSLYLLALTGNTKLGAITPIGGLCLLAAWVTAAWQLSDHY